MPAPPASRAHLCRKYRRETRNVRFCVLGPVFPDQIVWAQEAQKLKRIRGPRRRKAMTKQLPASVMVCSEYQRLLEESARTREAWSNLRYEVCWAELIPKKTIHEL